MNFRKIKKFILDLVSFGNPQAIVINFLILFLILSIIPTDKLSNLPIKSVFKDFLLPLIFNGNCPDSGIFNDCNFYSTGQTRAISRLLHGDFKEAWNYNKLVFILAIAILIIFCINLFKVYKIYKKTGKILNTKKFMFAQTPCLSS